MNAIINYTAWFNIFALAFNLVNDPVLQQNMIIKTRLGSTDEINLVSPAGSQALSIDLYNKNENLLLSYIMIPWQNMSSGLTRNGHEIVTSFPGYQLYTVNALAVIYLIDHTLVNEPNDQLRSLIMRSAERLFNYEQCETVIYANDGFTSKGGLQVMSLTEYPWYVDVHAATPGSSDSDGSEFLDEFTAKMVRLSMVPDSGASTSRWLKPYRSSFSKGFMEIEAELAGIYEKAIQAALVDQAKKKSIFESSYLEIKNILDRSGLSCDSFPEFCGDLLERLLFYDPISDMPFNPNEPFPDYVPKMTPDELLDFMPALTPAVKDLPEARLENLHKLIKLYKKYKKEAKKNPGEWKDGNAILGAKLEEYYPSQEELMLSEIGERIRNIASEEGSQKVKARLNEYNVKKKKIKYKKFSFIHMDVMGSGRYFYVDDIMKVKFKLY